eukprot:m.74300 g.74300  ORF g.74300 m.74300 type:complete len:81 (-) comp16158_c0_seq8:1876-2118(-)
MSLTKGIDDSDSSSDESDNEIDWASAYAVVAAIVHEHEQERTQEPAGPGRGIPGLKLTSARLQMQCSCDLLLVFFLLQIL